MIREPDRREGQQGRDVQTSLDAALPKAIRGRVEDGASVVPRDARDGEVPAMARRRGFDPDLFDAGVSAATFKMVVALARGRRRRGRRCAAPASSSPCRPRSSA